MFCLNVVFTYFFSIDIFKVFVYYSVHYEILNGVSHVLSKNSPKKNTESRTVCKESNAKVLFSPKILIKPCETKN